MESGKFLVSPLSEALVKAYASAKAPFTTGVGKIRVSRTVSAAAFVVERIRMAIEFRDESLMRRAAIERILKRRMVANDQGEGIALQLLRELIWAKYLPNNGVPETMVGEVQGVIDKYFFLRRGLLAQTGAKKPAFYSSWIIEVASCQIEEALAVTRERDAFLGFIYQHVRSAVHIKDVDETTENVQVYLAVSRAVAKSDKALLRYQLLKLLEPEFHEEKNEKISRFLPHFSQLMRQIDIHIHHPVGGKLFRYVRRISPPYFILRDILSRSHDVASSLSDKQSFRAAVWQACDLRYQQIGKKLRRLAVRSIIYIFVTKMLFALVVEVPLDQAIHGEIAWIPLAVNTTFPVLLMASVALTNAPPGEHNTQRIFSRLQEILTHTPAPHDHKVQFAVRQAVLRPVLTFFFTLLYGLTFIAVFGSIIVLLNRFNFTVASQFIFLFFLCVVTFFGYQVHQTANEYRFEEREGLLTPIFDFLLLPILRVGQWLSSEVTAGVASVFTFIFDFFFEIPLKSLFEILEEWFSFLRSKKEELN